MIFQAFCIFHQFWACAQCQGVIKIHVSVHSQQESILLCYTVNIYHDYNIIHWLVLCIKIKHAYKKKNKKKRERVHGRLMNNRSFLFWKKKIENKSAEKYNLYNQNNCTLQIARWPFVINHCVSFYILWLCLSCLLFVLSFKLWCDRITYSSLNYFFHQCLCT